jgi:hypothetical protein
MTGFISSLTAEQLKQALEYRGEENHGEPDCLRENNPTKGLLDRLTPEQRAKLFAFKGHEASGDQSLPKRRP